MKKNREIREDFRCSKLLQKCLKMMGIIEKRSIQEITNEALWGYFELDNDRRDEELDTGKNEIGITYSCSQEVRDKLDEEGERIWLLGKHISNDEIIRRALFFYFGAKNEGELRKRHEEFNEKIKGRLGELF